MPREGMLSRGPALALLAASLTTGCGAQSCNAPSASQVVEEPAAVSPGGDPALPGVVSVDSALQQELDGELARKGASYVPRTHHKDKEGTPKFTNRLIRETSPYLLQHAHNPVNWFAWGDEAFRRAKELGRPILLSVGYSTCHWCHVMERESFEDEEIAGFINSHFIAIKVDREERPDVDSVYMKAVRLLGNRGGWPMTVLMTPDKDPFFGGTYIPARDGDRGTRQGFLTLLQRTSAEFQSDPTRLLSEAQRTSQEIERQSSTAGDRGAPKALALSAAVRTYVRQLDTRYGGFGRAPKFPRPSSLDFLLRYSGRTPAQLGGAETQTLKSQSLGAATLTLTRMSQGGMFDHVGGGFHRYSTDEKWLVPHFEKMLYDNAQLVSSYAYAFQLTGNARYRDTIQRTLKYIKREMTSRAGTFYSASDADSIGPTGHMEEGYYFTWTPTELSLGLREEKARLVSAYYGVTPRGNFEGRTIFSETEEMGAVANRLGVAPELLKSQLAESRASLYEIRQSRIAPGLDDKVLTGWNGMMISALVQATWALDEPTYLAQAQRAADTLLKQARDEGGSLLRVSKGSVSRQPAFLEDYAFLIYGLLDVFEGTGEQRYLASALELQEILDRQFWDSESGGYFLSGKTHEELLSREKPSYDGAVPSGNSVAAQNLLRLADLTSNAKFRQRAGEILATFSTQLTRGVGSPRLLSALSAYLGKSLEVFVVRPLEARGPGAREMESLLRRSFLPDSVVMSLSEASVVGLERDFPLVQGKRALGKKATAYVCERGRCELPARDVTSLRAQLLKQGVLIREQ